MPTDNTPDPIQAMADGLAADDRACRRLRDVFDQEVDNMLRAHIPTRLLLALDYARGTAAALFPYLTSPQAADGPTQDQEPSRFTQHMAEALREYDNGFLTTGEMSAVLRAMLEDEETSQATREKADNAEQVTALELTELYNL